MDYYYYMALTQLHKFKLCSINTHSQPQSQSLAHGEGVECFGLDRLPELYGPSALRSLGPTLPHLLPPSIPSCATTWVRQGKWSQWQYHSREWDMYVQPALIRRDWKLDCLSLLFFSQYSIIKFVFLSIYYAQVTGGEGKRYREQRQPWSLLSLERLPE